jgi:hypothetical protein
MTPFVKVVGLYLLYNFYVWRFSTSLSLFEGWQFWTRVQEIKTEPGRLGAALDVSLVRASFVRRPSTWRVQADPAYGRLGDVTVDREPCGGPSARLGLVRRIHPRWNDGRHAPDAAVDSEAHACSLPRRVWVKKKASMALRVTLFLSSARSFVSHRACSSAPPCAPPRERRTSRAPPGAEGGRRRAKLCSHSIALPLLLVLLNTPSSSLVHLDAPTSTRPSRSGHSRPAPPPAPDDAAPGPTSTPNRPVHMRNGFQACSPADTGNEPPPASSSSPARTTLHLPCSF